MPWPTVPIVTTGMDADTDALPRADILDLTTKFNQLIAMRGLADGVCDLDATGKVPNARLDLTLTALAGLATGADQLPYATGTDIFAQTAFTPFSRTVLDDVDAPAWRATLELVTVTQAAAEAGTETTTRTWTAERVKQAIAAQAGIKAGTAVASTSGTAIDFTGIPAGTKRITVMFSGMSTNGASNPIIQLGDSGGVEVSGYLGSVSGVTGTVGATNYTDGIGLQNAHAATGVLHGSIQLSRLNAATFLWVASGTLGRSDAAYTNMIGSSKALSAELDRIRITTQGGVDTFDAGSINILYE